jgi:hypothetical protein
MASNICLRCRFGSVKLEILVPEKYDIKEFAKETQDFASDIVAITREKPMHYSLTFGTGNECAKSLDFRVHCSCILNINQNECSKFNANEERDCKVKHFIYSKASSPEEIVVQANE